MDEPKEYVFEDRFPYIGRMVCTLNGPDYVDWKSNYFNTIKNGNEETIAYLKYRYTRFRGIGRIDAITIEDLAHVKLVEFRKPGLKMWFELYGPGNKLLGMVRKKGFDSYGSSGGSRHNMPGQVIPGAKQLTTATRILEDANGEIMATTEPSQLERFKPEFRITSPTGVLLAVVTRHEAPDYCSVQISHDVQEPLPILCLAIFTGLREMRD
jgi:hypothetical protein